MHKKTKVRVATYMESHQAYGLLKPGRENAEVNTVQLNEKLRIH